MSGGLRNYTRWRDDGDGTLSADLLGIAVEVGVAPALARVELGWHGDLLCHLTPDEARLIGVRLIEAATLADGNSTVRRAPEA